MKLLFDENISYRIVKKLEQNYPESSHVKFHNLLQVPDRKVWDFAKKENFTIVSNDSDFNDFSLIWGFPPKIIWLQTGNTSTKHIVEILNKEIVRIIDFFNDEENGVLIFE